MNKNLLLFVMSFAVFMMLDKKRIVRQNPQSITKAGQKRVSKKIGKLRREGYDADQAAAIAYDMERSHKLGPRGGKKNPNPSKGTPQNVRAMLEDMEAVSDMKEKQAVLRDYFANKITTAILASDPGCEKELHHLWKLLNLSGND